MTDGNNYMFWPVLAIIRLSRELKGRRDDASHRDLKNTEMHSSLVETPPTMPNMLWNTHTHLAPFKKQCTSYNTKLKEPTSTR